MALALPLYVATILFLTPLCEKLLLLTLKSGDDIFVSAGIIQLFIFAIPAAFWCKINKSNFTSLSNLRLPSLHALPFTLISTLTYFLGAALVLYVCVNFLPTAFPKNEIVADGSVFDIALCLVIIPAFVEEIFFRSIILNAYKDYSAPVAIVTSALFFAMLHFSFSTFILYFLSGLALGLITYITGSCLTSILIHLINNTIVVFFNDTIASFLKESSSSVILSFILIISFLACMVWLMSTLEKLYEKKSELYLSGKIAGARQDTLKSILNAEKHLKKGEQINQKQLHPLLSPTFLLCVLIFIIITI